MEIPVLNWTNIIDQRTIGHGTFGSVARARYVTEREKRDVVIKSPIDITGFKREFVKEARLLYSLRGNENIVELIGISLNPVSLMQEYVAFSFKEFDDEKEVNNLGQFHADDSYDFEGFERIPLIVAKDLIKGVKYLHEKDIVHQDLKPANILVTNSHLTSMKSEEFLKYWQTGDSPIICKLTDFGESRSQLIQTQTLMHSKV